MKGTQIKYPERLKGREINRGETFIGSLDMECVGRGEYVEVADIIEEMDLVFWKEEGCRDGMHGSISPALPVSNTR